jgi:hypothetical protein
VAANTNPIFGLTPNLGALATARISTANTNRDGTGTLGTVLTGGTNGSRVDRIVITATATTTAGMVRLFISDGTNIRLWKEIAVSAITPSGTVAAFTSTISSPDSNPLLVLPVNYVLKAGTNNAESFDVIAHGADF